MKTNTPHLLLLLMASTPAAACTPDDSGEDGVADPDNADGNSITDDTSESSTGDGDPVDEDGSFAAACEAYGDLMRMCPALELDGDEAEAECLEYLEYYANNLACLEAFEAHLVCLTNLPCEEVYGPSCGAEEESIDEACPG